MIEKRDNAALGLQSMSEHDTDILLWCEDQGELLRRIAAGETVSSAEIDWPNIAEEVETLGWMQVDAVESLLFKALVRMLKAEAWRSEARRFRLQARRRFTPSMRNRINVYADALQALPETIDGQPPSSMPEECPVTLDELLSEQG